ncbi:MAG: hypothetical protein K9F98_03105 [Candidatus Planktophila sp.]|nr:hypothetical protein [Candidatus Planktophila sp.]
MKRTEALIVALLVFANIFSVPAQAVELTTCGSGTQVNRLDPPLNPTGELGSGMFFGKIPLTGLKGSKYNETSAYATWDAWNPGNVGTLETYFLYASSDGGSTWSCARTYALSAKVDGMTSGVELQVILLANKGNTWARSQLVKVPPINPTLSICPPKTYEFDITYSEALKAFFMVMYPHRTSADPNSPNFAGLSQQYQFIKYSYEATVDNWKTKVIGRDSLGSKAFSLGEGIWIKPLDSNKPHTFRAIPTSSELSPVDTTKCSPFIRTLLPKAKKTDPCSISVLDPNCNQEIVAGENSDSAVPDASPLKTPTSSKSTITCAKGKLTKKVTAVKPLCPTGYKKK